MSSCINMVLVVDTGDEPSFSQIVNCLVVTDVSVYFVCQHLHIKYHNSYVRAYVVEQGDSVWVVEHRHIMCYKLLNIHRSFGTSLEYAAFA